MIDKSRKELGSSVPGWAPELGTRLSTLYAALGGLSEASRICGMSDETLAKYRDGGSRPSFLALAQLAEVAGMSLDWLAWGKSLVPVVGLAECGLKGWYKGQPLGLLASVAGGPEAMAVIAVGDSMVPAGIKPGDLVVCQPGTPRPGDSVLIELTDGHVAIKSWVAQDGDWVTLRGWLPPQGGLQLPYADKRKADQLRKVRLVTSVGSGLPPMTAAAPRQEDDGNGRLYTIAIETTLQWLDDAGLEMDAHNVTGLIQAAVGALGEYGPDGKTDADLIAEVRRSLGVAKQMLAALGWKPR